MAASGCFLVGGLNPSEQIEFVRWDYHPQSTEKTNCYVPVTTNQISIYKSQSITIFLWFSYGFPMVFLCSRKTTNQPFFSSQAPFQTKRIIEARNSSPSRLRPLQHRMTSGGCGGSGGSGHSRHGGVGAPNQGPLAASIDSLNHHKL